MPDLHPSRTGFPGTHALYLPVAVLRFLAIERLLRVIALLSRNEYDTHFLVRTYPRRVKQEGGTRAVCSEAGPRVAGGSGRHVAAMHRSCVGGEHWIDVGQARGAFVRSVC
jgi:hypothetical protein